MTHDFERMDLARHYSAEFKWALSHIMVHLSVSGSTVNVHAVLGSVWHLIEARLERNQDLQKNKKGEVQEEKFNFTLSVV